MNIVLALAKFLDVENNQDVALNADISTFQALIPKTGPSKEML